MSISRIELKAQLAGKLATHQCRKGLGQKDWQTLRF
jgi:hypothetical protein